MTRWRESPPHAGQYASATNPVSQQVRHDTGRSVLTLFVVVRVTVEVVVAIDRSFRCRDEGFRHDTHCRRDE
jgi:hypothetical protein